MNRDEFAKLVGDTIAHYTYAENAPSIRALGLLPAAALARAGGLLPEDLHLRDQSPRFTVKGRPVRLNHQLPLRKGRNQSFLDGHTIVSWSAQLDERVFFLPHGLNTEKHPFSASLGGAAISFHIDARAFFDAFAPDIWLSPINSGNADRRASVRGDWLYVRVDASPEDFRTNRVRRALVTSRDSVKEISIRRAIPADLLATLMLR